MTQDDELALSITGSLLQPLYSSLNMVGDPYVAVAWSMVKKAGIMVNIELYPYDCHRHAATYASRPGTPIETVSNVYRDTTSQSYLGKVNDIEVIRD